MTETASKLSQLSREELDLLLEQLRREKGKREAAASVLGPRPRGGEPLPLSFAQQRLWLLDELDPGSPAYNVAGGLRLRGALTVPALARGLAEIVRRHETLRTTFGTQGGVPVARFARALAVRLPVVDLAALASEAAPGDRSTGASFATRAATFTALGEREARRPFDLGRGPLIRAVLVRLAARDHGLLLAIHHIVSDGWSLGVLVRELAVLYRHWAPGDGAAAGPPPLPELGLQYADFAAWQRDYLSGELLGRQLAYWKKALAGLPPALELPADRPRPAMASLAGRRLPLAVAEPVRVGVAALARKSGATTFMVVLAGYTALLARLTGQRDLVVGSTIANRNRSEIEGLIGCFVNTLPLRSRVAADLELRALLARVRETTLSAYAHQDLPFEKLVEELAPARSLSHSPLFQVALDFQADPMAGTGLPGLELERVDFDGGTAKFDLLLSLSEGDRGLVGYLEYATDLFDASTARRLARWFEAMLAAVVAAPDTRISKLPLLAAAERHQMLADWGPAGPAVETEAASAERCLHQLFEAQARRTPEAVALVDRSGLRTSYRDLDLAAEALASVLRSHGVGPEVRVGVCLERGRGLVVALLAVLKAGGAYVPFDPLPATGSPPERLRGIFEDSRMALLVTQGDYVDRLPVSLALAEAPPSLSPRGVATLHSVTLRSATTPRLPLPSAPDLADGGPAPEPGGGPAPSGGRRAQREGVERAEPPEAPRAGVVLVDTDGAPVGLAASHGGTSSIDVAAQNLAYLIYTSGSTGRPKGVAITHRSAVALAHWARETWNPAELAGVLASTSICFDLSVFEIFVTLAWGGKVILAANALELPEHPAAGEVTLINTVPSAIAELARQGALPPAAATINLAGEALQRPLVDRLYALPQVQAVWNLYGPSEDTTYSTWHRVPPAEGRGPAIGRPVAGSRAYLLDRGGWPAPLGAPGELCLAGVGLARGYHDRPSLTAEKFVPDPFSRPSSHLGGERLYRTGDLARWLPVGDLDYLGRIDHQVKVRGFRIELGEIEAALASHPAVAEVVVAAREVLPGETSLVAYVVAHGVHQDVLLPAAAALDLQELRRTLGARLPEYMVPAFFVELESLPLNANGKVDRRALPAPRREAGEAAPPVAPRTPLEARLTRLFADVLGVERVGVEDNFFRLGGHSLRASQLVSRLRDGFDAELPLRLVFEHPTVAELAPVLEGWGAGQGRQAEADAQTLGALLAELRAEPPLNPSSAAFPAPPITRLPRNGEPLPLSFAQERMWFLHGLDPGSPAYNIAGGLRLAGPLAAHALAAALAEVVRRHEALRTVFVAEDGRPAQRIEPSLSTALPVVDLSALTAAERAQREGSFLDLAARHARRPFDLARGPLLGAVLVRFSGTEHGLLLGMHHVVSDGWSLGVLVRELAVLYDAFRAGRPSPLPELAVQYADFAAWQRAWLAGEELERQLAYWRGALGGLPPALELPTDRPRPAVQSLAGGRLAAAVPDALRARLGALAQQERGTLFMVLLAAFQALLGRWTGQRDLAVGASIANRGRSEIEGLIGFFVNTLALRARLDRELSFRKLLRQVRETTLAAYAHQDLPFEKLVEALAPARTLATTPLVQAVFGLQSDPLDGAGLAGISLSRLDLGTGTAKFDLLLSLAEGQGGLGGHLEYASDLFDRTTMERLLAHWGNLIAGVVETPEAPLASLPLLSAAERHELAVEWRETGEIAVPETSLCGMFAAHAASSPEAVALVTEDGCLSYGELAARAARLAGALSVAGVGPEVRVGICLERSAATVISMLAVHQAGGAYVGFDPPVAAAGDRAAPAERLAFLLADSAPRVLLTEAALLAALPEHEAVVLLLDREGAPSLEDPPSLSPRVVAALHSVTLRSATTPRLSLPPEAEAAGASPALAVAEEGRSAPPAPAPAAAGRSASFRHVSLRDPAAASASPRPAFGGGDAPFSGVSLPSGSAGGPAPSGGRRAQRDGVERAEPPEAPGAGALSGPLSGNSLSHLIYTSGSTGRPKGVAVEHRATVVLAHWAKRVWSDWELGGVSAVTSICWDVSVAEILVTLALGGRVILARNALHLLDHPAAPEMRLVTAVPSAVTELVRMGALPPNTVTVNLPGEAVKRTLVDSLHALPGVEAIVNLYGPSEDTTYSTWEAIPPSEGADGERRPPTIGRPVANGQAYVLDARLQPVPPGVPGHLYLAGDGVSRGYHARPALTAERYVPDPLTGRPGARMYTTGDRVRFLPDARLDFLGRLDHQVKVRGFRVELGEIEAALLAHPGLREAVVVAREEAGDAARLVAYVSARDAAAEPTAAELAAFLAGRLPDYMAPARFVILASLPRTPNGKIDRRALPAIELRGAGPGAYLAPRTATELALAGLFAELLGLDRVGAEADFFALGGHSLLATRLASRLRKELGVELPLRKLFETPTVAMLAAEVDAVRSAQDVLYESALPEATAAPAEPSATEPSGADSPGPAPARLSTLSRDELGKVLARLKRGKAARDAAVEIPRRPRNGEPLPLSFAQQRLWFLHALDPGSPAYNVAGGLRMRGLLDAGALARALAAIVRRHESLRTVFADRDGVAVQVVLPSLALALPVADLASLPAGAAEAALAALAAREARRPFDLGHGPLLRPLLVRLGHRDHALLLAAHHVVCDGWSVTLLLSELGALYTRFCALSLTGGGDEAGVLPELPIQYADFAAWQREWLAGEVLAQQAAYWREALAGLPAALELPADRPRPPVASLAGGWLEVAWPASLGRELAALARRSGGTLFMGLMAGFQALLFRYTGRRDLVVGTTIANRNRSEIEGLIGFFVNTLALRTGLGGELPFATLLERVREATLSAFVHQDLPFEKLVDEVAPARSLSHSPLFQVALDFQSDPLAGTRLPGLAVEPITVPTGTAKFDLLLSLAGGEDGLTGYLEYASDLFDRTTVERLRAHLRNLLTGAVESPEAPLASLPLLSAAERHELAVELAETGEVAAPETSLAGMFAAHAAVSPEAIALVTEDGCLSCAELARRSARLAAVLAAAGVGPEVRVGICLERSAATVISMLAVHQAGGAYVGFDPPVAAAGDRAAPAERLAFLLSDSRPQVLLTQEALLDALPEHDALVLCLNRYGAPSLGDPPSLSPRVVAALHSVTLRSATTPRLSLSPGEEETGGEGEAPAPAAAEGDGSAPPTLAVASAGRSASLRHVALRDPAAASASPRAAFGGGDAPFSGVSLSSESAGGPAPRAGSSSAALPWGAEREEPPSAPGAGALGALSGPLSGNSLSHLIYTSGSTGRPKGVAVEHRATVVLAHWAKSVWSDWELGGVSAVTSICWDVSVAEILVTLALGGRVILARNALHLLDHPAAPEMRLVTAVPSAVTELVRMGALPPNTVTVNLPGEAVKRTLVDAVYAVPGVEAIVNLYGPSEDTTYSTWEVIPPSSGPGGEKRPPTVGRPVANSRAYVLDTRLQPAAPGVPGHLYLAGEGVSRGYHARPGLTAERYVPDPLSGLPGARMYTTGDLVRVLPDGRLDFLGRIDHQVKVRGFRVELGEIEAALLAHPGLREAVVVARQDASGTARLVAYVSARDVAAEPTATELVTFLATRLPDYMVPAQFVMLAALPLTPNGKVDRKALPEPDPAAVDASAYQAPRTPAEVALAAVFAELLGAGQVGANDSFFALGGHSLSATRLLSRLRQAFGVELPLRTVFEHPTVAGLAGAVERATAAERDAALGAIVPLPRPEGGELPLSFAQQRLWLLDRLDPASVAYLIPAGYAIEGPLDVAALAGSLDEIVRRHEGLRTVFATEGGRPVARVVPAQPLPLPVIDLGAEAAADLSAAEARAEALARVLATRPFELSTWPLLRCTLVRLAPSEHRLVVVMHHIITDGWSMGVLTAELAALYGLALARVPRRGSSREAADACRCEASVSGATRATSDPASQQNRLLALPVQYADFAAWQREWLEAGAGERQLAYWRERLADLPALELPADRPRPPVQSLAGATHRFVLARELGERLTAFAAERGATLFMALLAGFEALLSRLSGQRDFAVGSPVAGRRRSEVEPLIGFFVNTLVLRADLSGGPSLGELLDRTSSTALAAYAQQDLPFERLVEELAPARDLSYTPLFQVMLALQNAAEAKLELPGLALDPLPLDTGTAKFDLLLGLSEMDGGLAAGLEYSTALFDAVTVRRWARSFEVLLRAALAAPEAPLASLPLLSAEERHELAVEWRETGEIAVPDGSLAGMFAAHAAARPEAIALVTEDGCLSCAELARRSARLAAVLAAAGVGPEVRVGICLERSAATVISMLAVHQAGGAYVGFDPPVAAAGDRAAPAERLAFLLADSRPQVLLTQEALLDALPEHDALVLCLNRDGAPSLGDPPSLSPRVVAALHSVTLRSATTPRLSLSPGEEETGGEGEAPAPAAAEGDGSAPPTLAVASAGRSASLGHVALRDLAAASASPRPAFGGGDAPFSGVSLPSDSAGGPAPRAGSSSAALPLGAEREEPPSAPGAGALGALSGPLSGNSLSHLIYTSGSTGRPKGVAVEHRATMVLAHWAQSVWSEWELGGVSAVTSICWDVSVAEILVTLALGGRVILARNALHLLDHPAAPEMRLVTAVPSAVTELVRMGALPPNTVTVNLPGEAVKRTLVDAVYAVPGVEAIVNLYGPSEDTTYSTWEVIPPSSGPGGEKRPPTVGRPVANSRAYVLDTRLQPAAPGVPGHLYLAGEGVSRGYHARPGLTAERYVPDPLSERPGARMYTTGDRVRFLPDGRLDFLGRIDHQVKVRGFRVELGEIEAVLLSHPALREAVVVARQDASGTARLVAYVSAKCGVAPDAPAEPTTAELAAFLSTRLPDYMVPTQLVRLAALPLNANGKVDRKALPEPEPVVAGEPGRMAPRTPTEETLARLFAEVLFGERAGAETVGVEESFFRLGGHSLSATRLVSRLREELGADVPLRTVFEAPTVAALASRIDGAAAAPGTGTTAEPPLVAGPRPAELPLSFAQERLWFLDLFEPGNAAYNVPTALRLTGTLAPRALAACFAALARRHESLRTTFSSAGGRPSQRVASEVRFPVPAVDLSCLPPAAAALEAECLRGAEAARPFDLARGPLLRAALLRLSAGEHHLLLDGHHIAVDGWSITILVRELAGLYEALLEGRPSPLPPLPLQYADFALWQRRFLAGAELERQLAYWRGQLAGAPQGLELPADWPRAAVRTYSSGSHLLTLPAALVARLTQIAERRNASLFMALLAGFKALLARLSGEEDVVVGTPIAGRNRGALEGLIGMFLNTLVLRTDLSGRPSFEALIDRVRETALAAYAHQDLPFEKLLDELKPERDLSRTPLFQVFFNMLNLPAVDERLPGLEIGLLAPPEVPSKFDLTVYAQPIAGAEGEEITLHLVYNAELFSSARVAELGRQLVALFETLTADPGAEIGAVSLISEPARPALPDPAAPLSDAWNGAIHELASRQAHERPDRIALQEQGAAWSYGRLEAESNRLAHCLIALGVAAGDPVAIYAHRSGAVAWAVLGALKAGGAFVMLDPAYPEERLAQMLRLARPRAFVRLELAGLLPAGLERFLAEELACPMVALPPIGDAATGAQLAAYPPSPPAVEVGPDSPACLGFTSGSTGVPKGVVGRHGPLTHFLPWQCRRFSLEAGDRFSLLSGLAHDPLQRDLFTPFFLGAAICVPDPGEILVAGGAAAWMARQAVSVAHLTPAMGQVLTEPGASGANEKVVHLRFVLLVGDVLTRRDAGRIRDLAPGVTVVNLYGSTETQRAVSYHVVDLGLGGAATAGAPPAGGERAKQVLPCGAGMEDVQVLVVNRHGQLAGVGELGEIYMRSPHLAAGYLDDPELTAEKFLANPFAAPGGPEGDRLYRTGDLGRYLPDGEVVFVGRADKQVKVRGFRVELGEIEAAIGRLPGVVEAVVLLKPAPAGDARLVAYVVAAHDRARGEAPGAESAAGDSAAAEIKEALRKKLPAYMVPAALVLLDRLPLTPNGKVDREALKKMSDTKPDGRAQQGPQTEAERIVLGLFRDLLQVEHVGVEDNFFEMGGNSLLLVQLQSRLQQAFSRPVAMVDLFDHPTIRDLARHLAPAEAARQATVDDEQWGERLKQGRNRLKQRSRNLAGAGLGTQPSGARDEQFGEP